MTLSGIDALNRLFRRCVQCPTTITPSCPSCDTGYVCQVISISCETCPSTSCIVDISAVSPDTTPITATKSSSPNVGAIAGGVIGGVAVIAVATYLVWRFCIKPRRQQYEQENWAEDMEEELPAPTDEKSNFAMQRDARASTYTVGSIASTVLTRASNIIQIAYIPGVTNRSTPSTPGLLVPPVPPIPIALSSAASTPLYDEQHFFMPGDLRDSTYSGISDRTSYARTSVASTIYGKNAIVSPLPAQTNTIIRGKAAVVSVGSKTPATATPGELTPPVPVLDYAKYKLMDQPPPSPAFSVGSTFLSNASVATATAMRPTMVSVSSASKSSTLSKLQHSSSSTASLGESSDDETSSPYRDFPSPPLGRKGGMVESSGTMTTFIDDNGSNSPLRRSVVGEGPFSDPVEGGGTGSEGKGMDSMSRVIRDVTRRATARPISGLGAKRTPFGDEHSIDE